MSKTSYDFATHNAINATITTKLVVESSCVVWIGKKRKEKRKEEKKREVSMRNASIEKWINITQTGFNHTNFLSHLVTPSDSTRDLYSINIINMLKNNEHMPFVRNVDRQGNSKRVKILKEAANNAKVCKQNWLTYISVKLFRFFFFLAFLCGTIYRDVVHTCLYNQYEMVCAFYWPCSFLFFTFFRCDFNWLSNIWKLND